MSKKAFDLMPPYGKKDEIHHHPAMKKKKEKVKAKKLFFLLIMALIFVVIFLGLEKTQQTTQNKQDVAKKTTANSGFELFDDKGQSALTESTQNIKIRLLDGASDENIARTVKDTLLKKGYTIESSQKSATPSPKTIIYYQKDKLSQAQGVQTLLKDPYNPTLEESDLTSTKYDVLVLIGG